MSKDQSTPVKAKYNRFGDEEQPSEAETPSRKRPLANVDTDKAAPADKIARIEVDVQRDGGLALIHGLPHGSSTDKVSRNELFMDIQEIVKAKRRKIIEALSKGKSQYSGHIDSGNNVIEMIPDASISIQEMEAQFYQGYPKWRKTDYAE